VGATRKNVVLVQPGLGDMDVFRDRPTPPLGLLSAASGLDPAIEARIVDQRVDPSWSATLARAIDGSTVAVGVTAMTGGMIEGALRAAEAARAVRDVPIVWGGVHASLLPGQTAADSRVDHVVQGEGEVAFPALVGALAGGRAPEGVPGVWTRGAGSAGSPAPLLDLDRTPPVPYGLVDMERYLGTYRGRRMFFYQGSRGCPFRCAYCYNAAFNRRRWRARSAARVLEDLRELRRRYQFDSVYFLDDDFFIDVPRASAILEGLAGMGLTSVLQGVDIRTVSRFSDEDLSRLERWGVERISIGVESGSDRVRGGLLHKWGTVEVVRAQLRRLRERRFLVLCTFIVGFPGEKPDEIRGTIELALWTLRAGSNFRIPQIYNYVPYPGTELFRGLEERGASLPRSLEGWAGHEWDRSVLDEHTASRDELERLAFLSKFLDRKDLDYGFGGIALRLAYRAYRPVARLRVATGLTSPLPERGVYDGIRRLAAARRRHA
jgi:radical SAM superfamily enzyme YgiQ (UPF0313 family)